MKDVMKSIIIFGLMALSFQTMAADLGDEYKKILGSVVDSESAQRVVYRYDNPPSEVEAKIKLITSAAHIIDEEAVVGKLKKAFKLYDSVVIYDCAGVNLVGLLGGSYGKCLGIEVSRDGRLRITKYTQFSVVTALGVEAAQYEDREIRENAKLAGFNTEVNIGSGITYIKRLAVDWLDLEFGNNGESSIGPDGSTGAGIGHTLIDVESAFNIPSNEYIDLQLAQKMLNKLTDIE